MRKPRQTFLAFTKDLKGLELFRNGKPIAKYILYWGLYDSQEIIFNRTDVTYKRI